MIFPFSFVLAIIPLGLSNLSLMLYNPNCVVQVYVHSQSPDKVMRNFNGVGRGVVLTRISVGLGW